MVTLTIALLMQQKEEEKEINEEEFLDKVFSLALKYYASPDNSKDESLSEEHKSECRGFMNSSLSKLALNEGSSIGYTYKCMGSSLWAFKQKEFEPALRQLILQAGDADTNGAVAGALLGCKLGYENLPQSWIDGLVHRDWLFSEVEEFCKLLGV